MGIGAVFGALNTMYSAVAERSREIHPAGRGLGSAVFVVSFVVEACASRSSGSPGLRGRLTAQRPDDGHHQLADLLPPGVRIPGHAVLLAWGSCSRCSWGSWRGAAGHPCARARIAVALREL